MAGMLTHSYYGEGSPGWAIVAPFVLGARGGYGSMPAIAQALALNSSWPTLSADSLEHWQQARQALFEAAGSNAFLQAADMRSTPMHAHFPLQRDHHSLLEATCCPLRSALMVTGTGQGKAGQVPSN